MKKSTINFEIKFVIYYRKTHLKQLQVEPFKQKLKKLMKQCIVFRNRNRLNRLSGIVIII